MRRFFIAAVLALLLHVLLFSASTDRSNKKEIQWARPEPITLALTYYRPPKPRPKPQERIVSPKPQPKPILQDKKPAQKKVVQPPPPPPLAPPPPEKQEPVPEPKEVHVEEVKPQPPLTETPIPEPKESAIETMEPKEEEDVVETIEPQQEQVIETASIPEIKSIDAIIMEDMADEPPAPGSLPLQMAIPAFREEPVYPRIAKRRGYEGTVILKVLVGVDGSVADLEILESSGHDILDQAAGKSVRKWMFEPWKKGDEPIEMWGQVVVRFQLR
ncbi:MAG: energy transducer TonB [Deltaproteobacteria bacterium]|nr:energy transducer TonB [Deltaproteobacteria bacterium]